MTKADTAYRTIGEAAESLAVPPHVLRFWETRFPQVAPRKSGSGRRCYRPEDLLLLASIRRLLYDEGYTIKGVQRLLRSQGVGALRSGASGTPSTPEDQTPDPPLAADPVGHVADPGAAAPPDGTALAARLRSLADVLDGCVRDLAAARARAIGG